MKLSKYIYILVFIFITGSCKKKYPEDSAIPHFYSPYKRIADNWSLKGARIKIGNYSFQTVMAGKFKFYSGGQCSGGSNRIEFSGTGTSGISFNPYFEGWWELIENNSKLRIHHKQSNNHFTDFEIRKLDSKKMILENDSVRFEFKEFQSH